MIRSLFNYVKRNKLVYSLILFLLLAEYFIGLFPAIIIQDIINGITNQNLSKELLDFNLLVLLTISIVGYFSVAVWAQLLFSHSDRFRNEYRISLFRKLSQMRQSYYHKFTSGDMLTRFNKDIESFANMLGHASMGIFISAGLFLFVLPMMLYISIKITILAIIPMIIMSVIVFYIGQNQDLVVERVRNSLENLNQEVLEIVEGVRVIRAYSDSFVIKKSFEEKTKSLAKESFLIRLYHNSYGRISIFFLSLSTSIVLYFGSLLMEQSLLNLGELIALQIYSMMLIDPVWMLTDFILIYQEAKLAYQKLEELQTTSDDIEEHGSTIAKDFQKLTLKNYNFTYQNLLLKQKGDKTLKEIFSLKDISLTLEKGKVLGIAGMTGSGKTTLVRQLLRQYPLGSGDFFLNDKSILEYDLASWYDLFAYVPQEGILFSKSIKENIMLGKHDALISELEQAISNADFTKDLTFLKDGMDTLVGEKGVSVSGGQKQRVLLARAFLKKSPILILDDALSAVDANTERKILENIRKLNKNQTQIIVSHRLSAFKNADEIIVLDNGSIIERGTHEELCAQNGWYKQQELKQRLETYIEDSLVEDPLVEQSEGGVV